MGTELNTNFPKSPDVQKSVVVGDTIICMVDEWRSGKKVAFDGTVLFKNERGVDIVYLSGFRSRNDFVEWVDIVAKLDLSYPKVELKEEGFSGHFQVFKV